MAQQSNHETSVGKKTAKGAAIGVGVGAVAGGAVGVGIVGSEVGAALAIGTGVVISAPVVVPAAIGAAIGAAVIGGAALIVTSVAKNEEEKKINDQNEKVIKTEKLMEKAEEVHALEKKKKEQIKKKQDLEIKRTEAKQTMDIQKNAAKQSSHNEEPGYTRDPSQIIIVMIGKTGNGKSTLGNRICGDTSNKGKEGPFKTSSKKDMSCTTECHYAVTNNYNKNEMASNPEDEGYVFGIGGTDDKSISNEQNILIIDTPGYGDVDQKNEEDNKDKVVRYLKGSGGVNAFVMVMSDGNRIDASAQEMLKEYETIFGVEFWSHLIIVVTRVDDEDDLQDFHQEENGLGIQKLLKEQFKNLNEDISVIPIGKKTYKDQVQLILDEIPKNRFTCDTLKTVEEKYQEIKKELIEVNQILARLNFDLNKAKNEFTNLKQRIETLTAGL